MPFQNETHRLLTMNSWKSADYDAIFIEDDFVYSSPVKLVDFKLQATRVND